jgi:hypothetical protein
MERESQHSSLALKSGRTGVSLYRRRRRRTTTRTRRTRRRRRRTTTTTRIIIIIRRRRLPRIANLILVLFSTEIKENEEYADSCFGA